MSTTATILPVGLTNIERLQSVQKSIEAGFAPNFSSLRKAIAHIHANPEIAFEEYIAHDTLCDYLESLGFEVTRKAFGVETAFEVLYGQGGRLVSIAAEYDALPGVGHGCGHHLIAATSVAAFLGLVHALKEQGVPGRAQLLGCPAEENQGGKVALVRGGAMKGVDAAVEAHPVPPEKKAGPRGPIDMTGVGTLPSLAMTRWVVEYHGRAAHAAGFPHQGINAYDAAIAAYNNISFLRQQTLSEERIHGVILEGPTVPNTIGHYTKSVWVARSLSKGTLLALSKRMVACFEAAATATGCTVEITEGNMYLDQVITESLCQRYADIANSTGGEKVTPFSSKVETGSTDFGNFTYECPGVHAYYAIDCSPETIMHHQSFTEAAGTEDAYTRATQVGVIVALTAWDLLTDDAFFEEMKKEWEVKLQTQLSL
ncbi:hypothetical protein N7454_010537 [Penicillium verhagenii]|nr:hypothetical protein N7454_010537 [Penicillium verhagenii]